MTTEDHFHALLDADPADHLTRLVLADWLADHDRYADEDRQRALAEGYTALKVNGRDCTTDRQGTFGIDPTFRCPYWNRAGDDVPCSLPDDWFKLLEVDGKTRTCAPAWMIRTDATVAELNEAAALAFTKLPPHRRQELLAPKEETANG